MKRKITISHSSTSCFKRCPEKHYLQYVLRAKSKEEGASLAFGIAIDHSLCTLLEAKKEEEKLPKLKEVQEIFNEDIRKGWGKAYDNPKYRYTRNDYVPKVLKKEDWEMISLWEKQLKTSVEVTLKAANQKAYKKMQPAEDQMWSRMCWISLKRKGELMLEAFYNEVLPKIKKVIAIQYKLEGKIGNDLDLKGYIDLICTYEGYKTPIIFDIKTAARPYESDSVKLSEQLLMYLAALGKELDTHLVGYLVMSKSISSDVFCGICGTEKESRHKTCPAKIANKRCGGEWKEVPKATIQELVDEVSDEEQAQFLRDISNLSAIMESGLRYRNFDSCKDFGMCNYYYLCHKKDIDSVNWPSEETKEEFKKENKNGK